MSSENESHLKRIRKHPLILLTQLELLAKKVKNILACLTKVKKRTEKEPFFKKFHYPKPSLIFHVVTTFFFEVLTTKITSCQTLRRPS